MRTFCICSVSRVRCGSCYTVPACDGTYDDEVFVNGSMMMFLCDEVFMKGSVMMFLSDEAFVKGSMMMFLSEVFVNGSMMMFLWDVKCS